MHSIAATPPLVADHPGRALSPLSAYQVLNASYCGLIHEHPRAVRRNKAGTELQNQSSAVNIETV